MSLPRLESIDGRPRLMVNDQPFLILGLQWDCDSCFSAAEINPVFREARRMGALRRRSSSTRREIERERGRYDFSMRQELLSRARENDMRIVPLWYGSWKNASPFYAPDHIREERPERDGLSVAMLEPGVARVILQPIVN